jgi:hypothetical protein
MPDADTIEISTIAITHIDLRGHARRQSGEIIDLAVVPEGYSEKWSHEYWQGQAEQWSAKENLVSRLAELDPDGADHFTAHKMQILNTCSECGEQFTFRREGTTLIAESECAVPGGIQPYSVLLNVPSGRIVMANDLRELTQINDNFNVNKTCGQVGLTKAYAEDGMVHIFVGNTCPGVYEKDGKIEVGLDNSWQDDEEDLSAEQVGKDLGSICTDLWWYSAMDGDLFEARCAEQGIDPKSLIEVEVNVEPGVYAFSDELADRDAKGYVTLSCIQKVDVPAPKLRPRQSGTAICLQDSHFWKEVERLGKMKVIFPSKDSVLADIFTVLGNGYAWHDGYLRNASGRSEDEPFRAQLKPVDAPRDASYVPLLPNFKVGIRGGTEGLYPMCWNYSKLGKTPRDADPHWMAAGMMFLRSALATEVKTIGHADETPEVAAKETEKLRHVIIASLDVLCEIAAERGIDKDGTLDGIFAEIQQAWA